MSEIEEATTDPAVMASWGRHTDARGILHRTNPDKDSASAWEFDCNGVVRWVACVSPGARPWTRVHPKTKPAPATLAEVWPSLEKGREVRRRDWRNYSYKVSLASALAKISVDDLDATDWVFVDSDGLEFSPNGVIDNE